MSSTLQEALKEGTCIYLSLQKVHQCIFPVEMSLSEAENSTSESEFDDGSTGAATLSGCGPTRPVDSASDSTIRDQDDKTRGVGKLHNLMVWLLLINLV